jgi:hypothetical protein
MPTVEAFGRGEIDFAPVAKDVPKAHIYLLSGDRRYTLGTVARFLGWLQRDGGGRGSHAALWLLPPGGSSRGGWRRASPALRAATAAEGP